MRLLLKIGPILGPCNNGFELFESRPQIRVSVLVMIVQCIVIEVVIQLHLAPMVGCLLVSQVLHACMHLELHPLYVS